MPLPRRLLALAVATAATVPLAVAALSTSAASADVAPAPVILHAGQDFASDAYSDPWDMSNAADLDLDPNGATLYVSNASMSGGLASFSTSRVSYVSFIWAGVPGSLPWGRDGRLTHNQINAASYTRANLHVYASAIVNVQLQWAVVGIAGTGSITFTLQPGWNTVDMGLTGAHDGVAWSGRIQNLRLQVLTATPHTFAVDWLRVYQPDPSGALWWTSAAGTSDLRWSDGSGLPSPAGDQHGGPVAGATAVAGVATLTNLSGFPPGTQFYAGDGTTPVAVSVSEPLPVIDSPSASGCVDYAGHVLHTLWNFTSPHSVAGLGNVMNVSYSPSGRLTATNAGPHRNDPYVLLPVGRGGIDGRVYHRLTIIESYTGGFNLSGAPGGGTLARVLWRPAGHITYSQTNDLVTPTGLQTIVLDMAMPSATLTEPEGTPEQRLPFASAAPVTTMRFDPNEDPGSRTWSVYWMTLAADCASKVAFPLMWHDNANLPGSTATVVAMTPGGHFYPVATVPEVSGENEVTVIAGTLPPNRYTMIVRVTTPYGASHTTVATGPLVIGRP
jgi:hypothetical protein